MEGYGVNPKKQEFVEAQGLRYACYAVHTKLVTAEDTLCEIVGTYVKPLTRPGDVVFLSEKMVACTEGRAIPLSDIHPGFFARLLSRFVTRSPYGIGLAMPETMACAIEECGLPRILLAAAAGAFGRLFHRKGWFYRVAGEKAAAIDGPCSYTIPPYNRCVVLGPRRPDQTAQEVSRLLGGNRTLIVDANDLGCRVLGMAGPSTEQEKEPRRTRRSKKRRSLERRERRLYESLLRQNPLGQSAECTPAGILRPAP